MSSEKHFSLPERQKYFLAFQPSRHSAEIRCPEWLQADEPAAIGHRVVHGGPHLTTHQRITPAVFDELQRSVHFAPLHIPSALRLIKEAQKIYPKIPHFACFDTAFHRTLPEAATRFALPGDLFLDGVRRYAFMVCRTNPLCVG